LKIDDVWWFDYPDNQPQQLLDYLNHLVKGEKDHYKLIPATFEAHREDWANALFKYLTEAVAKISRSSLEVKIS
jgi:hypothetical protein